MPKNIPKKKNNNNKQNSDAQSAAMNAGSNPGRGVQEEVKSEEVKQDNSNERQQQVTLMPDQQTKGQPAAMGAASIANQGVQEERENEEETKDNSNVRQQQVTLMPDQQTKGQPAAMNAGSNPGQGVQEEVKSAEVKQDNLKGMSLLSRIKNYLSPNSKWNSQQQQEVDSLIKNVERVVNNDESAGNSAELKNSLELIKQKNYEYIASKANLHSFIQAGNNDNMSGSGDKSSSLPNELELHKDEIAAIKGKTGQSPQGDESDNQDLELMHAIGAGKNSLKGAHDGNIDNKDGQNQLNNNDEIIDYASDKDNSGECSLDSKTEVLVVNNDANLENKGDQLAQGPQGGDTQIQLVNNEAVTLLIEEEVYSHIKSHFKDINTEEIFLKKYSELIKEYSGYINEESKHMFLQSSEKCELLCHLIYTGMTFEDLKQMEDSNPDKRSKEKLISSIENQYKASQTGSQSNSGIPSGNDENNNRQLDEDSGSNSFDSVVERMQIADNAKQGNENALEMVNLTTIQAQNNSNSENKSDQLAQGPQGGDTQIQLVNNEAVTLLIEEEVYSHIKSHFKDINTEEIFLKKYSELIKEYSGYINEESKHMFLQSSEKCELLCHLIYTGMTFEDLKQMEEISTSQESKELLFHSIDKGALGLSSDAFKEKKVKQQFILLNDVKSHGLGELISDIDKNRTNFFEKFPGYFKKYYLEKNDLIEAAKPQKGFSEEILMKQALLYALENVYKANNKKNDDPALFDKVKVYAYLAAVSAGMQSSDWSKIKSNKELTDLFTSEEQYRDVAFYLLGQDQFKHYFKIINDPKARDDFYMAGKYEIRQQINHQVVNGGMKAEQVMAYYELDKTPNKKMFKQVADIYDCEPKSYLSGHAP